MSTDKENGRGNKKGNRDNRGSRNPKHGERKHYIVHKPSRLNLAGNYGNIICRNFKQKQIRV
jgi:hypothetical protein